MKRKITPPLVTATILLASLCAARGSAMLCDIPFYGDRPLATRAAGAVLINPLEAEGRLTAEGLVLETGRPGPEIEMAGWDGAAGTIAFWMQPVGWSAAATFPLVMATGTESGGFVLQATQWGLRCVATAKGWSRRHAIGRYPGFLDAGTAGWRHLAVSWRKGGHFHLYVDGVAVYKLDDVFPWPEAFSRIRIGPPHRNTQVPRTLIKDFQVYARPLMESELALLASASGHHTGDAPATGAGPEVVTVGLTGTPPVVDGVMGPDEYPTRIDGLLDTANHYLYPEPGAIALAADDTFIYIGATIVLPEGYEPKASSLTRNDHAQLFGDSLAVFVRQDADLESKVVKGAYLAVGPNGNIYDCYEIVDWGPGGSNTRDTSVDYSIEVASEVAAGRWTVELRAPLAELGLDHERPFALSVGFLLNTAAGRRRIVLRSHPVWFDHYQAFVEARFSPVGSRVELGHLAQGQTDVAFALRNDGAAAVTGRVGYMIGTPEITETVRDWVYDELIGEEVAVTAAGFIHGWNEKFDLAAGGEAARSDSFRINEPGVYLLRVEAFENGAVAFRRTIPFVYFSPLNVDFKPVHSQQQIKAVASFYGVDLEGVGEIGFGLTDAAGQTVWSRFPVGAREETYFLSMAELAPGRHMIEASLFDQAGAEIAARALPFEKWADPEWIKNPVGLEALEPDWVPPPWTPVTVEGLDVGVWGRTFRFSGDSVLPGLISQETALTAGPAVLAYELAGERHAIRIRESRVVERHPGRVVVVQTGDSDHFEFAAEHVIEFDGLDVVTLTLTPKHMARVARVELSIPLAGMQYRWLYGGDSGMNIGRVGQEQFARVNSLWMGGDEVGLVWSAESYRGWQIDSQQPRVALERDGETTWLRLFLANTPTEITEPMSLTFLLHPTPLKPLPAGFRDWRFSAGWTPDINLWSLHRSLWNSALTKPTPRNWDVLREAVAFAREHDQKVYTYLCPLWMSRYHMIREDKPFVRPDMPRAEVAALNLAQYAITERDDTRRVEEAIYFAEDWSPVPPVISGRTDVGAIYYSSPSSSYADYFVHSVEQLVAQGGIDGIYMDLAGPTRENLDPAKGLGYQTNDGAQEGAMEFLAARDFYKRLYHMLLRHHGPEGAPLMLGHGAPLATAYTAFWGLVFHGEAFKPLEWFDYTRWYLQTGHHKPGLLNSSDPDAERTYEAILYRVAYPQAQFGIPMMVLPQYSKGSADARTRAGMYRDPALAREILSFVFTHDQLLWPSRIHRNTVYDFWKAVNMSEWQEATFHPYWSNGVASAPESVRVSYWQQPGADDYLIAVANWSDAEVAAEVSLPSAMREAEVALDVESGERWAMDGALRLLVGAHDLRVLRVTHPTAP